VWDAHTIETVGATPDATAAALSFHGAAKESNLPSGGLLRPAGFEDRMGHQAHATPGLMLERAGVFETS
jgi:hypothetical protein